jgi:hypothetical protein
LGRFRAGWADLLLVAVTELNTPPDLDAYLSTAAIILQEENTWHA